MKFFACFLHCIFIFVLSCQFAAAQQGPKTIPGVFRSIHWDEDYKVIQVSPDGNKVTFEQHLKFHTLLLKEGRIVSVKPKWTGRLSPDHAYIYTNQPGIDDGRSNAVTYQTGKSVIARQYVAVLARLGDDNPVKVFIDTNFIVGMNAQNQLIVSTAWTNGSGRIKGLKGLRLLDSKTFSEIGVLRTDTILPTVKHDYALPRIWLNSTHTALLRQKELKESRTLVYPFGSDSVVECESITYYARPEEPVDQHYLYENTDSGLNVYSIHSGKKLYLVPGNLATANRPWTYRHLVALAGNGRLLRYDQENKTVYEEQVTDTGLRRLMTYPLSASNPTFLSGKQSYFVAAAAGPSLVFVPRSRIDGNVPENEGYVLHLPTGKLSLRIAPFYNPDSAFLAQEAKARLDAQNWPQRKAELEKKECDEKLKRQGLSVGSSVESGTSAGILRSYDCAKDYYTLWIPKFYDTTLRVDGATFRTSWKASQIKWVDCFECKGGGYIHVDIKREETKEVPQGYFSGVTTTVTKKYTEKGGHPCQKCNATGKVRK